MIFSFLGLLYPGGAEREMLKMPVLSLKLDMGVHTFKTLGL